MSYQTDIAGSPPDLAGSSLTTPLQSKWSETAGSRGFQDLLASKRRTIGPMLVLSIAFFLLVTLLAGFARPLMTQKVFGPLGLGYVLIIVTYLVCWVSAIIYVNLADRVFDPQADAIAIALRAKEGAR